MRHVPRREGSHAETTGCEATMCLTKKELRLAKGADPMTLAALVLGYNEMARSAKTLGDKVFFRLRRDKLHEFLKATGSDWVIEFKEKADDR